MDLKGGGVQGAFVPFLKRKIKLLWCAFMALMQWSPQFGDYMPFFQITSKLSILTNFKQDLIIWDRGYKNVTKYLALK